MWELLEAYDWEFSSARASCDCKIESFRGAWLWAQMLLLNAKLSILQRCDFQCHTFKAPGMCAYYIARGGGENSLTLNPISAAGWWNPPFLQVFLSPSPQISIDQLQTLWLFVLSRHNLTKIKFIICQRITWSLLSKALCFTTYLSLYLHRIFKFYFFFFLAFIFGVNLCFGGRKHTFGYIFDEII